MRTTLALVLALLVLAPFVNCYGPNDLARDALDAQIPQEVMREQRQAQLAPMPGSLRGDARHHRLLG
ncbi:MAG TPA: hypothetical protein VKM54_14860 [Myxococcota bacterium]|nr:hypothetical protein [Myxococcota bacterium]